MLVVVVLLMHGWVVTHKHALAMEHEHPTYTMRTSRPAGTTRAAGQQLPSSHYTAYQYYIHHAEDHRYADAPVCSRCLVGTCIPHAMLWSML
jgi:hypothetical protein